MGTRRAARQGRAAAGVSRAEPAARSGAGGRSNAFPGITDGTTSGWRLAPAASSRTANWQHRYTDSKRAAG